MIDQSRFLKKIGAVVLGASVFFSVWVFTLNFQGPVAGEHSFRQSQTVLTVQRMLDSGIKIDYETPLFGPPWKVPFEFPTFQVLAATTAKAFSIDATSASRAVSIFFFYFLCIGSAFILKELGYSTAMRLITVGFLLFSPLYLNWSRTPLIESTTLSFGIFSYLFALRAFRTGKKGDALISALFMSLLILTKVTTAPIFMVLIGWLAYRGYRNERRSFSVIIAASIVVGVILEVIWNHHCDVVKSANPLTVPLMSGELTKWTFGAPLVRFNPNDWKDHLRRVSWLTLGQPLVLFGVWLATLRCNRSTRRTVVIASLLGCLPVFIFYNLQRAHSYYSMANAFLFIFTCGLVAEQWAGFILSRVNKPVLAKLGAFVVLMIIPFFETRGFMKIYYVGTIIRSGLETTLPKTVSDTTATDEVLLVLGADWDPTVPSELKRPAIVWAEGVHTPWETYFEYVKAHQHEFRIGGLVVCGPQYASQIEQLLSVFSVLDSKAIRGSSCLLYPKRTL